MSIEISRQGQYEVFETTEQHRILVLDNRDYYAWIETTQGHLLVLSDSKHQKDHTLHQGRYTLLIPHDEPDMRNNICHLELQEKTDQYHTYILPHGLPTQQDEQKKIVHTEDWISTQQLSELVGKR